MPFSTVQTHPDVCGNCFRRTHHTFERNFAVEHMKVDGEWETWFRKVDLPDRSYSVDRNRTPVPKDLSSKGTVKICVCGYPPGEQYRPLPKRLFFEYADNLYERYIEFGYNIDEETFFTELEALKTDPDKQFADDRIFETATGRALTGSEDNEETPKLNP